MLSRILLLSQVKVKSMVSILTRRNEELGTTMIVQNVLGPVGENAGCSLKGVTFEWQTSYSKTIGC